VVVRALALVVRAPECPAWVVEVATGMVGEVEMVRATREMASKVVAREAVA